MEMAGARVEWGTESNQNIVLLPWIMRRGTCFEPFYGIEVIVSSLSPMRLWFRAGDQAVKLVNMQEN